MSRIDAAPSVALELAEDQEHRVDRSAEWGIHRVVRRPIRLFHADDEMHCSTRTWYPTIPISIISYHA